MRFFSGFVDTFSQVISTFLSLFFEDDSLITILIVSVGIFLLFSMSRFFYRFVMDEPFSFSLLDWIKDKFQRDGKTSDKADNMDLMHTVEDHEPFVRSIKIVNVLLDRVMFEYVGDYAISERKDTMTIYYNENGEAKQFSFNKSSHIEVYEDVVE